MHKMEGTITGYDMNDMINNSHLKTITIKLIKISKIKRIVSSKSVIRVNL